MTKTYDSDLATDRDKFRFMLDDTDTNTMQFSDEEIAGLLTLYGTVNLAAAAAAERLAARFAAKPDISIDGATFGYAQKAEQYRALAKSLRTPGSGVAGSLGTPFVGGVSKDAIETQELDTDRAANDGFKHRPFDSGESV